MHVLCRSNESQNSGPRVSVLNIKDTMFCSCLLYTGCYPDGSLTQAKYTAQNLREIAHTVSPAEIQTLWYKYIHGQRDASLRVSTLLQTRFYNFSVQNFVGILLLPHTCLHAPSISSSLISYPYHPVLKHPQLISEKYHTHTKEASTETQLCTVYFKLSKLQAHIQPYTFRVAVKSPHPCQSNQLCVRAVYRGNTQQ